MSKFRKVYRFRMKPTKAQAHALNRMAGARRWVWNWGLARKREHYKEFGKTLAYHALAAELTVLKTKPETAWLKEADSQAMQQTLKDLDRSFVNFFDRRSRFPTFKNRKRDRARFRIPQRVKVVDGKVVIPKIGPVRIYQSQPVDEPTKSATFRRSADGKWYVSLTAEFEMPDLPLVPPCPERTVGIDLGLIDFATLSDGSEPIPAPKFFRKAQKKLRKAQRTVSRRKPGSKRKTKARIQVARIHRKTANQRNDFLHKLSTELIGKHDGLCIEDLSVKGLAKTKLAKSVNDAAWGEFRRQLEYKCLWNRKHLVVIDRWFPSSKMCNACSALNVRLTLSDREWDCDCGAHHKRDLLAACNIRDEGLRMLAAGQAESQNARRTSVRPHFEAVGVEPRIPRL
ncbi:putative transposase [Singulisphaera sp. GP187]|uniref:RNA-guided endonuclease InsQ/TnpB family protein n=1 Tax=Singulisphaera sp. GP187 TaxID=1882752 RepID=UPI000926869C|nr:RNA-guided endonuclease TnpB family protein [Singulisphaera sp. GP187]SIO24313.1 putative transposase [Singulisphaera sp. GP187]